MEPIWVTNAETPLGNLTKVLWIVREEVNTDIEWIMLFVAPVSIIQSLEEKLGRLIFLMEKIKCLGEKVGRELSDRCSKDGEKITFAICGEEAFDSELRWMGVVDTSTVREVS